MYGSRSRTYKQTDIRLRLSALRVFDDVTPRMVHSYMAERRDPLDSFGWEGGGSGCGNVLPFTLWQDTHLMRILLIRERIFGVQNRCLYNDNVCDNPI